MPARLERALAPVVALASPIAIAMFSLLVTFPIPVLLRWPVKVQAVPLLAFPLLQLQFALPLSLMFCEDLLRAEPSGRVNICRGRSSPSSQSSQPGFSFLKVSLSLKAASAQTHRLDGSLLRFLFLGAGSRLIFAYARFVLLVVRMVRLVAES